MTVMLTEGNVFSSCARRTSRVAERYILYKVPTTLIVLKRA